MLQLSSSDELHGIMKNLPLAAAVVDSTEKLVWVNGSFCALFAKQASQLVNTTFRDLPCDTALTPLGKEPLYYVPPTSEREEHWLRCRMVPLAAEPTEYQIRYFFEVSDFVQLVSEQMQLNEMLAKKNTVDLVTGLPNRQALWPLLESLVSRSRRYGNELTFMVMLVTLPKLNADETGDRQRLNALMSVKYFLKDQMRWADIVGRLDGGEFLLALPETPEASSVDLMEKLRTGIAEIEISNTVGTHEPLRVHFGISAWRKGDDVTSLIQRAQEQLPPVEPDDTVRPFRRR
jgi:diguanylate cyclase (GGDEF)-like protein